MTRIDVATVAGLLARSYTPESMRAWTFEDYLAQPRERLLEMVSDNPVDHDDHWMLYMDRELRDRIVRHLAGEAQR